MVGRTVAHYQILERVGEGGMGVVYKARDTHLDRFVAIKVLPPVKVADRERKRRFVQEAKAASALNHPNIVHIYDIDQQDGVDYIAMEYVQGKTLDELIPRKGMRLNEALKHSVEIADALAKAHSAGIIHRDLKPGNVMVGDDGRVKILDFGLAKLTEAAPLAEDDATRTMKPVTEQGVVVGTVFYMSPEQAEGRPVDARSDIFSFGSLLYEMLAGRRAFQGNSNIATLAAIVKEEPAALPAEIPHDVQKLVARCLRKDPERRVQFMKDLKVELAELKDESDSGRRLGILAGGRRRLSRWLWALAVATVLVLATALTWRLREASPPTDLRAVALTSYSGWELQPSFSPDGSKVAFMWSGEKEDNYDIYVKQIGSAGAPTRLTTDPSWEGFPAWSPDDRWIAFGRQQRRGTLIVLIPSLGGPERKLAEVASVSGLAWARDARSLVAGARDSNKEPLSIWAVQIETGERHRLTNFLTKSEGAETPLGDSYPSISPDGSALAFARQVRSFIFELYALRLTQNARADGEPRLVTNQRYGLISGLAWTADGREIVYSAGGARINYLWRVPVSGQGTPRLQPYAFPAALTPAIARTRPRLAYTWAVENRNPWRLDTRTKERRLLVGLTYDAVGPQYSPDGRKIAFQSTRSGSTEIWTCDAEGPNCLQLTSFGGPQCGAPHWSPDSQWLVLDSRPEGQPQIYMIAADGGTPRRITNHPSNNILPSWSSDGRWIYFASDRSGRYEVWKEQKDGSEVVQVTRAGGYSALESPDGRYIYFTKFSEPGLFRIPPQGGEEEKVLSDTLAWGGFGVTPRGIYFIAQGGTAIQLFDSATGKVSTLATLDKPSVHLTVSPNGAYITWSQEDRNTQDLMLVENFR